MTRSEKAQIHMKNANKHQDTANKLISNYEWRVAMFSINEAINELQRVRDCLRVLAEDRPRS